MTIQEIKTDIDNFFTDLEKKSDYELRGLICAIGILSTGMTKKYLNADNDDYKEIYGYIYDKLKAIDTRINVNTSLFVLEAKFSAKGQNISYESSFIERTYEEAVTRFSAKIKANYRVSKNISFNQLFNQ